MRQRYALNRSSFVAREPSLLRLETFLCALILAVVLLTGDWNLPEDDLAEMFETFELFEFRRYNDLVCLIDRAMLNSRI